MVKAKRNQNRTGARRLGGLGIVGTLLALVLTGTGATSAQAVTTCGPWHYIAHGQNGLNIKPIGQYLYATGRQSEDFWNQQFQFCRDPGWNPRHFAIRSNLGGKYWSSAGGRSRGSGVCSCSTVISNTEELFEIVDFDGDFYLMKSVASGRYLTRNTNPERNTDRIELDTSTANGSNLYRISPRDI